MRRARMAGLCLLLAVVLAAATGCDTPEVIEARAKAEAAEERALAESGIEPCLKIKRDSLRDTCLDRVQRVRACDAIDYRDTRNQCRRAAALLVDRRESRHHEHHYR